MQQDSLLERLAGGDREAFWDLWEAHRSTLYHRCLRYFPGRVADAEDALEVTMLKAWDSLPDYAGQIQNVRAWLTQLVLNVCADLHKRKKREVPLDEQTEPRGQAFTSLSYAPEEVTVTREMQICRLRLIDSLPPRLREPFILYGFREMSYREIAEQLNISERNARQYLYEAKKILRAGLHRYLQGSGGVFRLETEPFESLDVELEAKQAKIEAQADQLLNRMIEEIRSKVVETRAVVIKIPSGVEMIYYLTLDQKIARRAVRIETLRKYIRRYPQGWKKRLELAHLLYASGQWEEAIKEYQEVLAKQPKRLDVWLRLGETLRLMKQPEKASAIYAEALKYARKPATQHHLQGLIALCRGDYDSAAKEFEQAASLEPQNRAHWHALGAAHFDAGRPYESVKAYDKALELDPDDIVALTKSHNPLCAAGRIGEVAWRLTRTVELDPNDVYALKLLACNRIVRGFIQGEEGKKTYQLIRRAIRLAPDSPHVWEVLGYFYGERGEREKAVAVWKAFMERHPDNPQGWYYYANCLFTAGEYEPAADAILKALVLDPDNCYIYYYACEYLPYAGRMDQLRQIMEAIVKRFPDHWKTYSTAGLALARWFGEFDRACEFSSRAPQMQPHVPHAWFHHGEVLAQAGRYQEAVEALEHGWALQPEPKDFGHLLWLGKSYCALGSESKARAWFEELACRARGLIASRPASAYYPLALALEALHDIPGAIEAYQTALQHPMHYPARKEAEEALRRLMSNDRWLMVEIT